MPGSGSMISSTIHTGGQAGRKWPSHPSLWVAGVGDSCRLQQRAPCQQHRVTRGPWVHVITRGDFITVCPEPGPGTVEQEATRPRDRHSQPEGCVVRFVTSASRNQGSTEPARKQENAWPRGCCDGGPESPLWAASSAIGQQDSFLRDC